MRRRPTTKHRAPRRRTAARGGLRSAVTTVWAILAIPVALTLLCAVAEVAHLWLARLELQTGLESAALAGVKLWIVDAMRYTPHPTHSHLAQTLDWIARIKPERAVLTNMHIDLDYNKLKSELPPGVEPAYDGMIVEC